MEPTFIRGASIRPTGPRVLGLRLAPLTVGHLQLLLSLESPFAGIDRDPTPDDFFTAVFVCSRPFRESDRNLSKWWLPWFFRFWAWRVKHLGLVLGVELSRFRTWFEAQVAMPEFRAPPEQGLQTRSAGAPGPYIRTLFLMTVLRFNQDEALDCPVARANALYAAWADWEGRAELLHNPEFDALWKFAEEEDRKRFNPDGSRKEQEPNTKDPNTKIQDPNTNTDPEPQTPNPKP